MKKNKEQLIIPKTEVSIALYRKSDDGKMQKAVLGLDDLINNYSVVNQFADMIFEKHLVSEETIPEEMKLDMPARGKYVKPNGPYYNTTETVANALKDYRRTYDQSQREVAQELEIEQYHVTFLEKGKHRINEAMAQKLSDFLGIPLTDIIVKG